MYELSTLLLKLQCESSICHIVGKAAVSIDFNSGSLLAAIDNNNHQAGAETLTCCFQTFPLSEVLILHLPYLGMV